MSDVIPSYPVDRDELEELIIARLLNTKMAHARLARRRAWTKAFLDALVQIFDDV